MNVLLAFTCKFNMSSGTVQVHIATITETE